MPCCYHGDLILCFVLLAGQCKLSPSRKLAQRSQSCRSETSDPDDTLDSSHSPLNTSSGTAASLEESGVFSPTPVPLEVQSMEQVELPSTDEHIQQLRRLQLKRLQQQQQQLQYQQQLQFQQQLEQQKALQQLHGFSQPGSQDMWASLNTMRTMSFINPGFDDRNGPLSPGGSSIGMGSPPLSSPPGIPSLSSVVDGQAMILGPTEQVNDLTTLSANPSYPNYPPPPYYAHCHSPPETAFSPTPSLFSPTSMLSPGAASMLSPTPSGHHLHSKTAGHFTFPGTPPPLVASRPEIQSFYSPGPQPASLYS